MWTYWQDGHDAQHSERNPRRLGVSAGAGLVGRHVRISLMPERLVTILSSYLVRGRLKFFTYTFCTNTP